MNTYEPVSQDQLLDRLLSAFQGEDEAYRALRIPRDREGKRQLLRGLMNLRPPRPLDPEVLAWQDAYLQERSREKGVVRLGEVPSIAESLGSRHPQARVLSLWQGDITRLAVDAIVNAANAQMLGCFQPCHSCIDNCIHSFAGVQLRADCARQMARLRRRCGPDYEQPTALPMLTEGYNLPAKKVIHIVGPIVSGGLTAANEAALAACYRNSLDLCLDQGLRSVAFCGISTGVYRFPKARAAEIAVATVTDWLSAHAGQMDRVIFNVFQEKDLSNYEPYLH